jgi:uncharacterized protein (DUF2132 family)
MNTPHPRDPLHGVKLATILEELLKCYGWEELGNSIPIRCFTMNPSISSSLKFLRKTPWAREKVEALYREYLEEEKLGADCAPAGPSAHDRL